MSMTESRKTLSATYSQHDNSENDARQSTTSCFYNVKYRMLCKKYNVILVINPSTHMNSLLNQHKIPFRPLELKWSCVTSSSCHFVHFLPLISGLHAGDRLYTSLSCSHTPLEHWLMIAVSILFISESRNATY